MNKFALLCCCTMLLVSCGTEHSRPVTVTFRALWAGGASLADDLTIVALKLLR